MDGGVPPPGARVVALAGIGEPAQFAGGLAAAGWQVVATAAFADHHWFTAGDLERVAGTVDTHDAWGALTTDKDAVRLEPLGALPCAVARVPLTLDVPQWGAIVAAVSGALTASRGAVAAGARP